MNTNEKIMSHRAVKAMGQIAPDEYGRWVWPFASMHPGDWFIVAPEDREIARIWSLAANRGYQLGKRFSVTRMANGMTKVECGKRDATPAGKVDAATLRARIRAIYGIEANDLPWELAEGEMCIPANAVEPVSGKPFVAQFGAFQYQVRFEPDGLFFRRFVECLLDD
jgi:hypothetical protein